MDNNLPRDKNQKLKIIHKQKRKLDIPKITAPKKKKSKHKLNEDDDDANKVQNESGHFNYITENYDSVQFRRSGSVKLDNINMDRRKKRKKKHRSSNTCDKNILESIDRSSVDNFKNEEGKEIGAYREEMAVLCDSTQTKHSPKKKINNSSTSINVNFDEANIGNFLLSSNDSINKGNDRSLVGILKNKNKNKCNDEEINKPLHCHLHTSDNISEENEVTDEDLFVTSKKKQKSKPKFKSLKFSPTKEEVLEQVNRNSPDSILPEFSSNTKNKREHYLNHSKKLVLIEKEEAHVHPKLENNNSVKLVDANDNKNNISDHIKKLKKTKRKKIEEHTIKHNDVSEIKANSNGRQARFNNSILHNKKENITYNVDCNIKQKNDPKKKLGSSLSNLRKELLDKQLNYIKYEMNATIETTSSENKEVKEENRKKEHISKKNLLEPVKQSKEILNTTKKTMKFNGKINNVNRLRKFLLKLEAKTLEKAANLADVPLSYKKSKRDNILKQKLDRKQCETRSVNTEQCLMPPDLKKSTSDSNPANSDISEIVDLPSGVTTFRKQKKQRLKQSENGPVNTEQWSMSADLNKSPSKSILLSSNVNKNKNSEFIESKKQKKRLKQSVTSSLNIEKVLISADMEKSISDSNPANSDIYEELINNETKFKKQKKKRLKQSENDPVNIEQLSMSTDLNKPTSKSIPVNSGICETENSEVIESKTQKKRLKQSATSSLNTEKCLTSADLNTSYLDSNPLNSSTSETVTSDLKKLKKHKKKLKQSENCPVTTEQCSVPADIKATSESSDVDCNIYEAKNGDEINARNRKRKKRKKESVHSTNLEENKGFRIKVPSKKKKVKNEDLLEDITSKLLAKVLATKAC